MSCQALWPGGFLKVEPPVRLLIGCVASRDFGDLVHLGGDRGRIAALAREQRLREDVIVRRAAMAIGVMHVGIAADVDAALRGRRARASISASLVSRAIGAAIHAQRAADAAGNAAQERQAGDAGLLRRARDLDVGHRGAGAHARSPRWRSR